MYIIANSTQNYFIERSILSLFSNQTKLWSFRVKSFFGSKLILIGNLKSKFSIFPVIFLRVKENYFSQWKYLLNVKEIIK